MNAKLQSGERGGQRGSALLIAIFALLLISVVGIALLVSTGADSALAGNYRTATSGYYAAMAGLEESRGRLLKKNPDFINNTNAYSSLFSGQGIANFGLYDVLYIVNPAASETVDPTNSSGPYADTEYGSEFTWQLAGATVHTPVNSVSTLAGIPGPLYKWARINALTEQAIHIDINNDGTYDSTTPLFYDGNSLNLNSSGNQALEITALAVMPDNSKKLLQYVVAPVTIQTVLAPPPMFLNQGLPAALILAGNGVSYFGPNSTSFWVNGNDPTFGRTCTSPPLSPVSALGYTNTLDQTNVANGTLYRPGNYIGFAPPLPAPPTPSVGLVSLSANLQTPAQFESLIQTITQSADVIISGPANATSSMPSGMSPSNPMTVVVNGDLDFNSWHNVGYGLLLVTGNLNYDPDASWEGVVLVIGKGTMTGSRMGIGRFDGAILVAQTRDGSGNVLANLGTSSVSFASNMGGAGIYYNSCNIIQALAPTKYRVLYFREITQ